MAKKKADGRGGAREGAGRKPGPDGPVEVMVASVPSSLVERMDAAADKRGWNRSKAVTEAIRAFVATPKRG
jgi:hypothetical protein